MPPESATGQYLRCEAARRAGLERIRAVLLRETPDRLALELMLAENVQREGLDPIDEARAYQRLMDECRLTQAQLAARVGRSQPHVSAMLALLELPVDVQFQLKRGEIPVSHGKRLAVLADRPDECRRLAAKAARTSFPELSREVTQVRSGSVACPPPSVRQALAEFVALLEGRTEPLTPAEWESALRSARAALGRCSRKDS